MANDLEARVAAVVKAATDVANRLRHPAAGDDERELRDLAAHTISICCSNLSKLSKLLNDYYATRNIDVDLAIASIEQQTRELDAKTAELLKGL